jgi:annexin A7/11
MKIQIHYTFLVYKKSLESDIKGDTSGCFERLLISLCQGMRDETPVVNPAQVATDVLALFQAGNFTNSPAVSL